MTATADTLDTIDFLDDGCGPDCIYLDGACRCYEGGLSTSPEPDWVRDFPLELLPF